MNISTRQVLFITLLIAVTSFCTVFIYATFVNPVKKIYIEESIKAKEVAANELLFSDQFSKLFRSSAPTDFIAATKKSITSVVFIKSIVKLEDRLGRETYDVNSGSGVIVSPDGYIITNNHLVGSTTDINVVLNDNREYQAKVIGTDPYTDLALLKVEANNLPMIYFGNSDSLQVGEWVLAMGNPFRLQSTVTAGIVSAKGRNINILENKGIESFIQTDAAVNPGNSGGALVNTQGFLVGINTAIISNNGGFEGFSFAIPSNLVRKVIKDFKEYGAVQRGWMGVELQNIDSDKAKELKLKEVSGVLVAIVVRNGAAYDAGILNGDVIKAINGIETKDLPQLMEKLGQYRPGDMVAVTLIRGQMTRIVNVTLRNQLNSTDFIAIRKDPILRKIGIEVRDLDSFEKSKFKTPGVVLVSVLRGSILGSTNIEPGFIITKVNNTKLKSSQDLIDFLNSKKGTVVLEGFYENYPGEYPYTFDIE